MTQVSSGRSYAAYSASDGMLTLSSKPQAPVSIPPISSLFSLPSQEGETIIGITLDFSILQLHLRPELTLHSHSRLPIGTPKMILPVDPMAWGLRGHWAAHDVLLSVSEHGELAFWVPDENSPAEWRCTGSVKTHRAEISRARCSSAKKTALSYFSLLFFRVLRLICVGLSLSWARGRRIDYLGLEGVGVCLRPRISRILHVCSQFSALRFPFKLVLFQRPH